MRVVIIHEVFVEEMGYAATCIPKELVRQGVEVHYLTAGLPPYYYMDDHSQTYGAFVGREGRRQSRIVNGFSVHELGFRHTYGGVKLLGLREKIAEIKPDIVQTFAHISWHSLDVARMQRSHNFKLFTGNHTTASTYPLAQREAGWLDLQRWKEFIMRGLPGRFISSRTELCHGATVDCSDVAVRFFGVPESKIKTIPLGVDTDVFHPAENDVERATAAELRASLGVAPGEIMCVYTGRFSNEKNPLLLAKAVSALRRQGKPYRAVFFGEGVQRAEIEAEDATVVRAFVPYTELGAVYQSGDIGVWPTQESTSMIDAAASGLPIIVNDTIAAIERVEGNGISYRLNDQQDLERALLDLESAQVRRDLGAHGARKMRDSYSWEALVRERLRDYDAALGT